MPNQTYAISRTAASQITSSESVPRIYTNSDLPETVFHTHDDSLKPIQMMLKPEYSVTAPEALKLTMMYFAAMHSPMFSVYQYVKKNDLERHFKYS